MERRICGGAFTALLFGPYLSQARWHYAEILTSLAVIQCDSRNCVSHLKTSAIESDFCQFRKKKKASENCFALTGSDALYWGTESSYIIYLLQTVTYISYIMIDLCPTLPLPPTHNFLWVQNVLANSRQAVETVSQVKLQPETDSMRMHELAAI